MIGRRERDIVNRYDPREAMKIAPNPRGADSRYQARLAWDDVTWLQKTTRLPVGIKGIMTVRDAKRAVEMGVRIIWVSNHGGRQLDHTDGTTDTLPRIADAVGRRAEIVMDGGFSRGTDILGGLTRGAKVVAVDAVGPRGGRCRQRRLRHGHPAPRGADEHGDVRAGITRLDPELVFQAGSLTRSSGGRSPPGS